MNEINELRKQVHKFVDTASEKELEVVYHILEANETSDWWNEISPSQQGAIDTGLNQLDNGQGIAHETVLKNYEQWLKK